MSRRHPMRPHPLELPLVWAPILLVALIFAGAVAEGLTPPDASRAVSRTITVACLLVVGTVLYWVRRRYIPR